MTKQVTLLALLILPIITAFGQAGTLDPTFADNAEIKLLNFLSSEEELLTHSITDSQDRTWIAGQTFEDGDWLILLTRLDANGNYDEDFGGTGHAALNFGGNNVEEVHGLALYNEDLILAGTIEEEGVLNPFLIKYTSEGSLDTEFGENGVFVSPVEMNLSDIAIDETGHIYMAGALLDDNIVIVKHLPTGEIDDSFGFFGASMFDFPSTDQSTGIDLDSEGNIYVFGYGTLNGTTRGQISTLAPTGAINTDFTANGRKSITWPDDKDFIVSDGLFDEVTSSFYLVGRAVDEETELSNTAAVKISLDAEQDMMFNEDGWLEIDLGIGGDDFANNIIQGPGGFYLAANVAESPEGINSAIVHFNQEGQRVDAFGNSGIATINVNQLGADQALSLSTQADGKIILVGISTSDEIGIYGYAARVLTSNPLSTFGNKEWKEAQVYPNPATDHIRISGDDFTPQNVVYRIVNLQGKIVLEGRVNPFSETIPIGQLPEGAYVIQMDGFQPTKWIKTK